MSLLKLKAVSTPTDDDNSNDTLKKHIIDLGNASEVIYIPRFTPWGQSWNWFDYLDKHIPWTRPTIRVFGKSHVQPRDMCYVATPGLTELTYSGYQPHAYSWDDYPPLKDILGAVHKALPGSSFNSLLINRYKGGNDYVGWHADDEKLYGPSEIREVHKALPGSSFNSLLINRYKGGNDYVGWHADDEKLYGPTPEIASVSFGCEREFILKKKPSKRSKEGSDEPVKKRLKNNQADQHTFTLKHGSLLVMRGYTQRDWLHSVPKRVKAEATRINLTFRRVL